MKIIFKILAVMLLISFSVSTRAQEHETKVLIETSMGKVKVKLFNETPLHRDNFLKQIKAHRYEGLLFHRVIKLFMCQAGDINSKNAPAEKKLGDGDLGYTIPAEIIYPMYFHKRGALCAARESDETNPKKASSATQFYIVTGDYYTTYDLDKIEKDKGMKFTDEQRHAYMFEGGVPRLDGNYTVFGEVISGQEIIDEMQFVPTDDNDRPLKDVVIKKITIL